MSRTNGLALFRTLSVCSLQCIRDNLYCVFFQAFLVGHTKYAHSRLWITKDSGVTFKEGNVDFLIDGELTFHPKPSQANLILALSNFEQV